MEHDPALQIFQPGWDFWLGRDCFAISAPTQSAAEDLACGIPETLASWALNFKRRATEVYYPGGKSYRVPSAMAVSGAAPNVPLTQGSFMPSPLVLEPNNPLIEIYCLSLSPSLLREVAWFLEHPDQAGGIVRLADEQQVVMSYANAKQDNDYTAGAGVKKAVTWKRTDYWHPQDLADFEREARQRLELDNPHSFLEFKWRSFDPDLGIGSEDGWIEFTNRSRRVQDPITGLIYSVSHNLGMREIRKPVGTGFDHK